MRSNSMNRTTNRTGYRTGGTPGTWLRRAVPVLLLVGLMWLSEFIDAALRADLDFFGIRPRELDGLPGILLSPFLHLGFGHLVANTSALLVLGILLAWFTRHLWAVTIAVVLLGGLGVWLLAPPNTVTIGASGLVYGYAAFLAVYGFAARRLVPALIAVLIIALYGGLLWGVLPLAPGVSWQGHLFGALAGLALALRLGGRDRRVTTRSFV